MLVVVFVCGIIWNLANVFGQKMPIDTTGLQNDGWHGLWFPHPPGYVLKQSSNQCDNGKDNIGIDFDQDDKRHSYMYLCLGKRSEYAPNVNASALLIEQFIPAAYHAQIKCLNESINYSESLPTYGSYRPLAAKFGNYLYLPPQRWLHNLAIGAVVLLYHPCASSTQVTQLQHILENCVHGYVITPSHLLSSKRPLALLVWGKSLQMSVVDKHLVMNFIKEYAKDLQTTTSSEWYDNGLLNEASPTANIDACYS